MGFLLAVSPWRLSIAESSVPIQENHKTYQVRILLDALAQPWGMAFLPDGDILVTEKEGHLRRVHDGRLLPDAIRGLPDNIVAEGQGGLLDIIAHPDFLHNRQIFFSFSGSGVNGVGTEVARATLDGMILKDLQIIFRATPKSSGKYHFGSRLLFSRDGFLYITLGERGKRSNAQNLESHPGSLIRITEDGKVPQDNPWQGHADAKPEIFSYGHRNAQGIAERPGTHQIWIHEHGPNGGDELNLIKPRANYGWPIVTYGREYATGLPIGEGTHKPGVEPPVHYWLPSIATSGMTFYSGDKFPKWRGNLFVGSLKFGYLVRLVLEHDRVVAEWRMLDKKYGRIRDVRQGPDGFLYLLTDTNPGMMLRIEPALGSTPH